MSRCEHSRCAIFFALLISCFGLSGCTMYVWIDEGGWWPITRETYAAIDNAVIDPGGVLFVRVSRDHASAQTWTIDLTQARDFASAAVLVSEAPWSHGEPVAIMSNTKARGLDGRTWPGGPIDPATIAVGLQPYRGLPRIVVLDRERRQAIIWDLPPPSIAWATPNALGHVLVTPFTVVLDVALSPLYAVGFVLYVTGVIHGH